jgi:hypothetical protein
MEKKERLMIDTIERAFLSDDRHVIRAAVKACANYRYDSNHFDKWWETGNLNYRLGACYLNRSSSYLPLKYVRTIIDDSRFEKYDVSYGKRLLINSCGSRNFVTSAFPPDKYSKYYSPELLKKSVLKNPASDFVVKKWLNSDEWYEKCLGLYSVAMLGNFHHMYYVELLADMDKDVRDAAVDALRSARLSPAVIVSGYLKAKTLSERISWMRIAAGREDLSLPISPNNMDVSEIKEMRGIHIDDKSCDGWLKGTEKEKAVALYTLIDEPNVPYVIVNRALRDNHPLVHETALILAGMHNYPAHREFEPGIPVYKKCIGNVVVLATIPPEAEVRGDPRMEGRANLASITEVKGDFFGEPVGISFYDAVTQYRKGGFIKVDNFDYSLEDCNTTGFHFFSTFKEARNFYY